jgi:apolipoprotein D and lipocalin family protein
MKMFIILATYLSLTSAFAHNVATNEYIDVNRFLGKWYSIADLPQFFSRSCQGQTAEYDLINDKKISVLNTCLKKKGMKDIKGQAVVVNEQTNAELVVTFNNFFTRLFRVKGDYNIVKIDTNYDYVMVGSNNRKSLWIMSRQPYIDTNVLEEYKKYAKELGFPIHKLRTSKF